MLRLETRCNLKRQMRGDPNRTTALGETACTRAIDDQFTHYPRHVSHKAPARKRKMCVPKLCPTDSGPLGEERDRESFASTPLGHCLRSGSPPKNYVLNCCCRAISSAASLTASSGKAKRDQRQSH